MVLFHSYVSLPNGRLLDPLAILAAMSQNPDDPT